MEVRGGQCSKMSRTWQFWGRLCSVKQLEPFRSDGATDLACYGDLRPSGQYANHPTISHNNLLQKCCIIAGDFRKTLPCCSYSAAGTGGLTGSSVLVRVDPRPGSANSGSYATIADLEPLYARPCGSRASYYAASHVTNISQFLERSGRLARSILYTILFRQYTLFEAPRASNGIKSKKSIRGLTAKRRCSVESTSIATRKG
ncbi:hypothetical protein KQX54_008520 [Cotesia glomerata]|uniref:Uncharacterized protein n=1 Tax=Cotesia glomerata TaxID=32391 RepID=A0AAV7IRE8_COTGL|nr:hypothetical protein KQX54_008520 [Cotesia glomerata]